MKQDQRRIETYRYPIILALTLVIGLMTGWKLSSDRPGESLLRVKNSSKKLDISVDEVLALISERHVDTVDINRLAEAAIRTIVDSLDPHSYYMSKDFINSHSRELEGNYKGIGMGYVVLGDSIFITSVYDGSPADVGGIKPGAHLIAIDTLSEINDSVEVNMAVDALYDKSKDKLRVVFSNGGDKATQEIIIQKANVNVPSVPEFAQLNDTVVLVRINQFLESTSKEMLDMLEPLVEDNKFAHLILDLRGNPGGYLQESIRILKQFFEEKGKLLVYTQGRSSEKKEYKSGGKSYLKPKKIAVLIDENSASASEIVAGAVQDWDRGVIIGRRSFGKGLVQEEYSLRDKSKLRLTVARYYTPAGRLIQKQINSNLAYNQEKNDRYIAGELQDLKKIPLPDSTVFLTAEGDTVYGKRGIVPDIFIPLRDTNAILKTKYYNEADKLALKLFYAGAELIDDQVKEKALKYLSDREIEMFPGQVDEFISFTGQRYFTFTQGEHAALTFSAEYDEFVRAALDYFRE